MGALQTAFDFEKAAEPPERPSVEQRLRGMLGEALGTKVALTWTDNARIMISARRRGAATRVRLHHMFTDADEPTLRALARFLLQGPSSASCELREFIASRRDRIGGVKVSADPDARGNPSRSLHR